MGILDAVALGELKYGELNEIRLKLHCVFVYLVSKQQGGAYYSAFGPLIRLEVYDPAL